jgi:hypothetical protein
MYSITPHPVGTLLAWVRAERSIVSAEFKAQRLAPTNREQEGIAMRGGLFWQKRLLALTIFLPLIWLFPVQFACADPQEDEQVSAVSPQERETLIRSLFKLLGSPDAKIADSAEHALSTFKPSAVPTVGEMIAAEPLLSQAAVRAVRALGAIGGASSASLIYLQLSRWREFKSADTALASLVKIGRPAVRWLVRGDREGILPAPGRAAFHLLAEEDLLPGLREVWLDPGEEATIRSHAGHLAAGFIADRDRAADWKDLPAGEAPPQGTMRYSFRSSSPGGVAGEGDYQITPEDLNTLITLLTSFRTSNGGESQPAPLAEASARFFASVSFPLKFNLTSSLRLARESGRAESPGAGEVGKEPEDAEVFVECSHSGMPVVRLAAAHLLRYGLNRKTIDTSIAALVGLLQDPVVEIRVMAVESLGYLRFPQSSAALAAVVADESAPLLLRDAAKAALSRLQSTQRATAAVAGQPVAAQGRVRVSEPAQGSGTRASSRELAPSDPNKGASAQASLCDRQTNQLLRILGEPTVWGRSDYVSVERTEINDQQVFKNTEYQRDLENSQSKVMYRTYDVWADNRIY